MPRCLWDYTLAWCAEIYSHMYNAKSQRTGLERLTGDTPDISEWLEFDIYDQVWFWDSPGKEENPKPGCWLGVSHRIGSALCYSLIDVKGSVLSRTSVQHVTAQDLKSDDIKRQFDQLDTGLKACLNDENFVATGAPDMLYEEDFEDDDIDCPEPHDLDATAGDIEEDSHVYDEYLGAKLYFKIGRDGSPRKGTVKKRLKGEDGRPIGRGHHKPFLVTLWYENEIKRIPHEDATNAIAENLYSQVDSERHQQLIFREIIEHCKGEDTIPISQGTTTTHGSQFPACNNSKRLGIKG